ncbi:hypothetical protein Q8A67_011986 [Cirrhinus molitorella]|uniref:Uncharacterized protein n=1 Tax=Cirrhinus molitorella TaxID=172907 RepID=A0AA88TX06_9TELE|nr:hypothetical protein Q8A67_011986 [Cirrhinus molitorella]
MDDLVARLLQTQGDQISPASNQQDDLLPSPAPASTFNLLIFDQLIKQTPAFRESRQRAISSLSHLDHGQVASSVPLSRTLPPVSDALQIPASKVRIKVKRLSFKASLVTGGVRQWDVGGCMLSTVQWSDALVTLIGVRGRPAWDGGQKNTERREYK